MKEINSTLVMTSISNFGPTGSYRDCKVSELVLSELVKDHYSHGLGDHEPLKLGGNVEPPVSGKQIYPGIRGMFPTPPGE